MADGDTIRLPGGVTDHDHPLRRALSTEMHMRKLPHFDVPARLLQYVSIASRAEARAGVLAMLAAHGAEFELPDPSEPFLTARIGELLFCWEAHSEFYSATLIASPVSGPMFDLAVFGEPGQALGELPGEIMRATNVSLVGHAGGTEPPEWLEFFSERDLVLSEVRDGRARVWSDFRLNNDGFGRMLVEDRGLIGKEPVELVQRLLELGNYRKMALLGLPVAKHNIARIDPLEAELAEIAEALADRTGETEPEMERLSRISSELALMTAQTRYRMSATQAYAAIVHDRLANLASTAEPGQISLTEFTERRLLPAIRTCEAFSRRLQELAAHTSEISDMLRTRIDSELSHRNQELLASMDRRTALQLRLQQTVEGLSIVAITYYALGVWKYISEGLPGGSEGSLAWTIDLVLVVLVPLATWIALHRSRKQ